jgi:hypothetical protein
MLINCKECGHQVSDKADTCPNCNAKVTKVLNGYQYFFRYVFGFSLFFWIFMSMFIALFGTKSGVDNYYISGLKLNMWNDNFILINLGIGILITVLLAIKQHKKYQSLKAEYGN